jgi:hypothetical protein
VNVRLYKTNPGAGTEIAMARAESTGSASGIREFSDTTITWATIQRAHGAYLWLEFPSSSNLEVYGVKIAYTD